LTPGTRSRPAAPERLRYLAETVQAECALLAATDGRLFAVPMSAERAASLRDDDLLAERVDAFVARFGRLQDTLADKLLPAVLDWLAEPTGTAIDNLARAERLGWLGNVDEWLAVLQQRHRMIHEYVRDTAELAAALRAAHAAVPLLQGAAARMSALVLPT
jgi:hypothetical protein